MKFQKTLKRFSHKQPDSLMKMDELTKSKTCKN